MGTEYPQCTRPSSWDLIMRQTWLCSNNAFGTVDCLCSYLEAHPWAHSGWGQAAQTWSGALSRVQSVLTGKAPASFLRVSVALLFSSSSLWMESWKWKENSSSSLGWLHCLGTFTQLHLNLKFESQRVFFRRPVVRGYFHYCSVWQIWSHSIRTEMLKNVINNTGVLDLH